MDSSNKVFKFEAALSMALWAMIEVLTLEVGGRGFNARQLQS